MLQCFYGEVSAKIRYEPEAGRRERAQDAEISEQVRLWGAVLTMAAIHPRLQDTRFRFVLLGSSGEDLKKPYETNWQETANYQHDDPIISAHPGNVGICGGFGDLHILDCDDMQRWEELAVFPLIPATLTIESRPGHRQYYVTCEEHFPSGGLFDPEKTEINKEGNLEYVHVGDLKAGSKDGICGGQAVTPGSKHPSGSIYQVVVDAPIAEVSREQLQSIINKFRQSKKFNTNYQKAEAQVKNARKLKHEEKDPLDSLRVVDIIPPAGETSQSGDELRGDHPVHGSTNGGNYVINTAKNLWHCKRCESGGGAALAIAVKHGLISCSDACAGELRGDLFKSVLKIAREQYGMAGNGNGSGPKTEEQPGEEISEAELEDRPRAENPRLEIKLEPDNLISLYMRYGGRTCDAYPEYHYTAALSLISIATNRNLRLSMSQDPLYPNVWVMNLGKTTVSRKSAAISKFSRFVDDLFPYAALPQSYSPEGLLEELTEKPKGYLVKDEAAAMIEAMEKNYMLEMRDIYCILYDCKGYRRKIRSSQRNKQSEFGAKDPFINILCATTPEAFSRYTSIIDLTSGWLLRFIYTFPTYKKPYMHFKPLCEEDQNAYAQVLSRLSYLKGLLYERADVLEIKLDPEAWSYYQAWQEQRESELVDIGDDIQLAFFGRLAFTALKMAILFTVGRADYNEETTVSLSHVQEACRQADSYFIPIGRIIADQIAMDEANNIQEKVLATLGRNSGRMKWTSLMQKTHADKDKLEKAVSALVESEEVEDLIVNKKGQKSLRWILLRNLNKSNSQSFKPIRYAETKDSKDSKDSNNSKNSKNSLNSPCDPGIPAIIAKNAIFASIATLGKDGRGGDVEPQQAGIGPNPRMVDAPTAPPATKCAKCGADLTGHATVEKGGQVYCALPGCGYPPREKGEAEA